MRCDCGTANDDRSIILPGAAWHLLTSGIIWQSPKPCCQAAGSCPATGVRGRDQLAATLSQSEPRLEIATFRAFMSIRA